MFKGNASRRRPRRRSRKAAAEVSGLPAQPGGPQPGPSAAAVWCSTSCRAPISGELPLEVGSRLTTALGRPRHACCRCSWRPTTASNIVDAVAEPQPGRPLTGVFPLTRCRCRDAVDAGGDSADLPGQRASCARSGELHLIDRRGCGWSTLMARGHTPAGVRLLRRLRCSRPLGDYWLSGLRAAARARPARDRQRRQRRPPMGPMRPRWCTKWVEATG